jgi:hypothetical protein
MASGTRVMIERGRKKRTVAVAFDWPGWDRSGKTEDEAMLVLAAYRPRYAGVAALAGYGEAFDGSGELVVSERVEGIGMTDYYGLSGRWASAELERMASAELERKLALLRAAWATFDAVAARVSAELRKGPRGGGRDRAEIVRHANGAEIAEFAPKVGVRVPLDTRLDPDALRDYRDAFGGAIRDCWETDSWAGRWPLQFLIRRCTWHMLDHAWEMEDRDLADRS